MKKLAAVLAGVVAFLGAAILFAAEPLGVPDPSDIEYPDDEVPSTERVTLGKRLMRSAIFSLL